MTDLVCPDDSRLWPAVMGDSLVLDLEQHLENCSHCQERISSIRGDLHVIREVNWNSSPNSPPPEGVESLPESIGEYTILARLGSGGQADVYRAWHPRLRTDVVIKWFRQGAFPEAEPLQLTSVAQILSTIRHPSLAQVFDVGIEQDRHFLIMEYVSGYTFSDWIRQFNPTIYRMARVLAQAARAVDAVHRHGALHLDIKPGNILVDDEGNPRVIDFGMARLQGHGSHRSVQLSPGTPEYMSPEQCAGDSSRISVATDVYGLGAVLYSALCQQNIRTDDQMTLEPDWSLIRHVPWGLRRICVRALATRPEDRFDSVMALAKALDRFAERQSLVRRSVAAVAILVGLVSGFWGLATAPADPVLAMLKISSHRQIETRHQTVFETKCTAILAGSNPPCIVIATATTQPILVSNLVQSGDGDWRMAHLNQNQPSIRISDNAGPHLIMACSELAWQQAPVDVLDESLKSLHALPLRQPLTIVFDDRRVSLLPGDPQQMSTEESSRRQIAAAIVEKIRSALDLKLSGFSGIVVIPRSIRMVAALPEVGDNPL